MNVRHLSFRLLQVYIQVVRLGNISAAARALHLTQPTVSLQLKKLAEAVGEPLFDSRDGHMTSTPVGEELYRAACDVLGRFEDFNGFIEQARGGVGMGRFRHRIGRGWRADQRSRFRRIGLFVPCGDPPEEHALRYTVG